MNDPGNPATIGAVLLDLDGTLVASREGIISCIIEAISDLGLIPPLATDLSWVVGPPLRAIMRKLLFDLGDERDELAVERYKYHYERVGIHNNPLFPGIFEALVELKLRGHLLFLATSKPVDVARRILEAHRIEGLFSGFYGARLDESGAEKPELIGRLLVERAIHPTAAIMVGDRRFDISGAHANKMRALGVLWGYGDHQELEEAGADGLVTTPRGLVQAIEIELARLRPPGGAKSPFGNSRVSVPAEQQASHGDMDHGL